MKMLYDRANGVAENQPKSLLLMGNASYDNRKLRKTSGVSKLLVYEAHNSTVETQAYATDDYCGFLMDNAGVDANGNFNDVRAQMNIGVGRLPIRTPEQATQVVDKLCAYMDNKVLGKWKTQICFLKKFSFSSAMYLCHLLACINFFFFRIKCSIQLGNDVTGFN